MDDALVSVVEEEYNFITAKQLAKIARKYGLRLDGDDTDESPQKKKRSLVSVINGLLQKETQEELARAMLDAEWNRSMIVRAENYEISKRKKQRKQSQ